MTQHADSDSSRADWVLLLIARDALGVEGPEVLDPIRIQKGMFFVSQRGPKRDIYKFRPYNWGPFSSDLYGDLDFLVATGALTREHVPGRTWDRFRVTEVGLERARALAASLHQQEVAWLGQLRRFLTTRSFDKLLDDVYEAFPEYATESLYRR